MLTASVVGRTTEVCQKSAERRAQLAEVLEGSTPTLHLVDQFEDPLALLRGADEYRLEGIVSKRLDRPYRSGTQASSRGVCCQRMAGLVVGVEHVCQAVQCDLFWRAFHAASHLLGQLL